MFILYRFYKRRKLSTPYFRTICAVGIIIMFHVLQILIVFYKMNLVPKMTGDKKTGFYLITAGLVLTLIVVSFIIKEKDLQNLEYDEYTIRRGGFLVTIYIILSFALFGLLVIL